MKYMLDTNICIYAIKDSKPGLREYMADITPGEMCISSITLSELRYGAYKSASASRNIVAINQFLSTIQVLAFDERAADEYGKIRSDLEKRGCVIGNMDMLIAAHARSAGITVITNNTREFERVEALKIEDWSDKG